LKKLFLSLKENLHFQNTDIMADRPENKEVEESTMTSKNSQSAKVVVKIGMIGESQTGKTSLMVKYVEDRFDEEYIQTLGVNYMEKTIMLRNLNVVLSVWDLGGQKEYLQLMPLVCADAKVLLFVFDLTRKSSLSSIREWYKEARRENKNAIPFLVGAKYDLFDKKDMQFKQDITKMARKFAKAMKAPLIYCSSSHSINVKKIFKLVIAKVFKYIPRVEEMHKATDPIVEYKENWTRGQKKGKEKKKDDSKDELKLDV